MQAIVEKYLWRYVSTFVRGAKTPALKLAVGSTATKIGIILILATILGCNNLEETALRYNLNVAKIENIQQQSKVDANVYLKGKVQNLAPFLETGAYELRDATGSIWVFTTENLPILGEEMTLKARVRYQSITPPEMGADVGGFYVEELERIKLNDDRK